MDSLMTGPELQEIRHRLGLSTTALGRAFGYEGRDVTASGTIRKYESGERKIPPWLARLAIMFDRHGVPPEWIAGAPAPQKPGRKRNGMLETLKAIAEMHNEGKKK